MLWFVGMIGLKIYAYTLLLYIKLHWICFVYILDSLCLYEFKIHWIFSSFFLLKWNRIQIFEYKLYIYSSKKFLKKKKRKNELNIVLYDCIERENQNKTYFSDYEMNICVYYVGIICIGRIHKKWKSFMKNSMIKLLVEMKQPILKCNRTESALFTQMKT